MHVLLEPLHLSRSIVEPVRGTGPRVVLGRARSRDGGAQVNETAHILMPGERASSPLGSPDPRANALAQYLRRRAASFSLSADVGDVDSTAAAGMALLDAAAIAETMTSHDPRLQALSEAGCFESMPHDRARFVESPQIRAAILRPLVSDSQTGTQIITLLVATAIRDDETAHDDPPPNTRGL